MAFNIEGWDCQLVLFGSLMVLELLRDGQRLSCLLQPGESPSDRAFELISRPRCLLLQG